MMKFRRLDTGQIVEVLEGLGNVWIVGTLTPSGGRRRLKSPALPPRSTRAQCEQDLVNYAAKKGWPQANEATVNTLTPRSDLPGGRESIPPPIYPEVRASGGSLRCVSQSGR